MIHPQPTLVRPGYTEQDTWRDVLGDAEPLHCFSTLGHCIDAPTVMPAGSVAAKGAYDESPVPTITFRSAA